MFVGEQITSCIQLFTEEYCKDTMIDGYKNCSSVFGYDFCDTLYNYPVHCLCYGILVFVSIV